MQRISTNPWTSVLWHLSRGDILRHFRPLLYIKSLPRRSLTLTMGWPCPAPKGYAWKGQDSNQSRHVRAARHLRDHWVLALRQQGQLGLKQRTQVFWSWNFYCVCWGQYVHFEFFSVNEVCKNYYYSSPPLTLRFWMFQILRLPLMET